MQLFDIESRIERFVWSFTALQSYLDCQWSFTLNNLLRIPVIEPEATVFGTAVHKALESYIYDMRRSENRTIGVKSRKFKSQDELIEDFYEALDSQKGLLSKINYSTLKERGEKILREYHDKEEFTIYSRAEQSIRNVSVEEVPIKGNIDRLDFSSDIDVTVIDYKTGKYKPKEFKQGGKFWRQAGFYKILLYAAAEQNGWLPQSVRFDFLDEGKSQESQVSKEDQRTIINELKRANNGIRNFELFSQCNKPECSACNYAKNVIANQII